MAESATGQHSLVAQRIKEHLILAERLAAPGLVAPVAAVADELIQAFRAGGKLLVLGNGGSAADAQHLAAEFVGRCTRDRGPLPALALADSAAAVTSIANDYGFDRVFARQVEALARPGDVVIGMSTSGRSPNVVAALTTARGLGVTTVGLVGDDDSVLRDVCDHILSVPSPSVGRVQETHLLWGHVWAETVERALGVEG
jgi:D-sedoheptulose 7-phosphate isomerase